MYIYIYIYIYNNPNSPINNSANPYLLPPTVGARFRNPGPRTPKC